MRARRDLWKRLLRHAAIVLEMNRVKRRYRQPKSIRRALAELSAQAQQLGMGY